jgi:hypothetical protein
VLEGAGRDPTRLDELVDLVLLEADHPAEPVGGQLALIDEPIEGAGGDAEMAGGVGRGEPVDLGLEGAHGSRAYTRLRVFDAFSMVVALSVTTRRIRAERVRWTTPRVRISTVGA